MSRLVSSSVQQVIGISLYPMRSSRRMVSWDILVALRHFTQHGKDIRIDTMIRNTIVALVLLLSPALASAALIDVTVQSFGGSYNGSYWEDTGAGTYNTETTEILYTSVGSGVVGSDYIEATTEARALGLIAEYTIIACTSEGSYLCSSVGGGSQQAIGIANTVDESGSGYLVANYSGLTTTTQISPVPLPAAAWLFISAIAGLAGAKRLSRSKGSA